MKTKLSRAEVIWAEATRAEAILAEATLAKSTRAEAARAEATLAEATRAEATWAETARAGTTQVGTNQSLVIRAPATCFFLLHHLRKIPRDATGINYERSAITKNSTFKYSQNCSKVVKLKSLFFKITRTCYKINYLKK